MRAAAALALTVALCAPAAARAGAWTLPPGDVFLSVSTSYFESGGDFPYEEATVGAFGEVGAFEGVTLGASLEYKEPLFENAPLGEEATVSAHARFRVWAGEAGDVLSVQVAAARTVNQVADLGPPQESEGPSLEGRLLYGRGFDAGPFRNAWIDVQGAIRLRFEGASDEARIDATAGISPFDPLLLYVQSFNTIGLRTADDPADDFDVFKIAPTVAVELGPAAVFVSYEREIAERGIDELGERWRLGLWTRF